MSSFMVKLKDVAVINRGRKEFKDLDKLAASLQQFGQIQNIVVREPRENELEEVKGKPWVLVAGERRMRAALLAEIMELRAERLGDKPEWEQRAIELEENIQRQDMTWQEQVLMRAEIHELYSSNNPEWDQNATARHLKVSPASITQDLKVARALKHDPEIKKAGSKRAALQTIALKQEVEARRIADATFDYSKLEAMVATADAREWLRDLPSGSVQLVLTDLPFGIGYFDRPSEHNLQRGGGQSKFDDSAEAAINLVRDVMPELMRVTTEKSWIVFFMNEMNYDAIKAVVAEHGLVPEEPRWIWFHPNSRNKSQWPDRHARNMYEGLMVINRGKARIMTSDERPGNVLVFDPEYNERFHAHQKPVALAEELVRRFTLPGEVVIDFCAGSGALLAGAIKQGRKVRGCDTNPAMREIQIAMLSRFWGG